MADITVKKLKDFDNYAGMFYYAGKGLGVSAWGMNAGKWPAHWKDYPDHNHAEDGQEEVYIPIEGSGTLTAGKQKYQLKPGVFVRVGPKQKRQIKPGRNGLTMVMLGGMPGKAWPKNKIRGGK